jgi:hypothetical protein
VVLQNFSGTGPERDGDDTVQKLEDASGNPVASHAFGPGELPKCLLALGDNESLTVDFSFGDPLVSTELRVHARRTDGGRHRRAD